MAETKRHPWQDTIRQLEEERCEEMTNRRGPLPLRSSSVPRVPGHSARPPPIPVDYTNYNLPSSRRRPRVGIFRASSPHGGSATESNVDSLELALQDSSKTSSSTVSTTSRSPGRHSQDTSQETCSSGEDLLRVHDHQESYPPTRTPRNPASRPYPSAYSPNPTNPFANTPAFYYTTSHQNPIRHTQPEYYANTCQLPARNLSNDINDETKVREQFVSSYDPFSVAESTDGVENKTVTSSSASQMSGASSSEDPRYREKLGLHMLCAEATSQHDIAWRNALYLLGMQPPLAQVVDKLGRTALHVACEGNSEEDQNGSKNSPRHSTPPPSFMIRALLIANVGAVRQTDHHGRLPIHCLAASSGEVDSLQILVEAYPGSITVRDAAGFTPLALFLQNPMVHVSLAQTKILLGMTLPLPHEDDKRTRIRLRSGDHLNLKVEHLDQMMKETNPVYDPLKRYKIPEDILNSYPEDVRVCLKRLAQWDKRHNHQRQQDNNDKSPQDKSKDTSFGSSMAASVVGESETNPAAMASPTDRQLPLHMVVYRGLLDSNLQKSRTQQSSRSSPGRNGRKSKHSQHFHQQTLILLVRLLISAFPEGLITRDANGHTPLLLAMLTTNTEILPSQELLELLLGKRTAGFDSLPPWAQDVPYPSQHVYTPPGHDRLSAAAERYSNPAMVGTLDTCQLPLHVVAEEWGDQTSFIVAIYESYPGAIHVQDAKGRMPLHTLLQNYRRIAPNPQIVALLLSERVAQTSSDEGYLPFDLLVDCASHLPLEPSREPLTFEGYFSVPDPYAAFKQFFHASIIASSATARANLASKDGIMIASGPNYVQRRAEARKFLWRLRSLPPWLRRQACSVSFVQGLLVDELSSPTKCAFILMYGIFLALLLITFRRQLELYTETAQLSGFSPLVPTNSTLFDGSGEDILESSFLDKPMTRYEPWNTLAIYGLSAGLLCFQATFWACSWFLNEFQYLCLFNIWRWIDFLSVALSVLTTATIHEGFLEEQVLALGTAATGMLWLSVVGYLSNWWYGMAFFSGVILKVRNLLVA